MPDYFERRARTAIAFTEDDALSSFEFEADQVTLVNESAVATVEYSFDKLVPHGRLLPRAAGYAEHRAELLEHKCRRVWLRVTGAASNFAELDLGTVGTGSWDSVVAARHPGAAATTDVTVALVMDSGVGEGVSIDVSGGDVTVHAEDAVSTVADIEAAIAAAITDDDTFPLRVKTAGTGATVLVGAVPGPTDAFAAQPLAGGADVTVQVQGVL